MKFDKNLTFRVNDSWLYRFGLLLNEVASTPTRDRSRLVRQLLSKESFLWLDAAYIAKRASYFILIMANGDVFLRAVHVLELKAKRDRLPAAIAMKPEKQSQYQKDGKVEGDLADWIRSRWMMNHFSVWEGAGLGGRLLNTHVDEDGITSKIADLSIYQPAGTTITREIIIALRDYVQRRTEDDVTPDRGDFPIEMPTLNFDAMVVIDRELYRDSGPVRDSAEIGYQFRNLESARLEHEAPTEGNPIKWTRDRYPSAEAKYRGLEYEETLDSIKRSFNEFQSRVVSLADDRKVVDNPEHVKALRSISLPERFLFGRLIWPMAYQGLQLCMTWNKPNLKPISYTGRA